MKRKIPIRKNLILNMLISMITVVLITVFAGNLISIDKQMKQLPNAIKIDAMLSNLNGSQTAGLQIKESHIDGILASEHVVNPGFTVQLKAGFGAFGAGDSRGKLNYFMLAANCMAAVSGMKQSEIKVEKALISEEISDSMSKPENFLFSEETGEFISKQGISGDNDNAEEAFFLSSDRICLVDERLIDEKNLKIGDSVMLTLFYYRYGNYNDIYVEPFETKEYRIVGTTNMEEYLGEGGKPDIIVPFQTIRNAYKENGYEFSADSGFFEVKDPFALNKLKKEMHDIGLLPVFFQAEFHYDGNALTIRDETFIRSAEQLVKSRRLLLGVLPFLALAVLSIGFVMAQLLMKTRTPEYAIMRSLGQSHRESIFRLIRGYIISAFAGSVIGGVPGTIILKTPWSGTIVAAVSYLICYLIGTLISMSALKKVSIIAVLSKND